MKITIEFKPQFFWFGVFPERKPDAGSSLYALSRQLYKEELHIWICLLPCLPVHIVYRLKYRKKKEAVSKPTSKEIWEWAAEVSAAQSDDTGEPPE